MAAPDEKDYLFLAREFMLMILELQLQIGVFQLVIQQKTSITLEDLQSARSELDRRMNSDVLRDKIRALGFVDLLKMLKDYEGTIQ